MKTGDERQETAGNCTGNAQDRRLTIREAFDWMADAHMEVFGMKNSPHRERVWAAMKRELLNLKAPQE